MPLPHHLLRLWCLTYVSSVTKIGLTLFDNLQRASRTNQPTQPTNPPDHDIHSLILAEAEVQTIYHTQYLG